MAKQQAPTATTRGGLRTPGRGPGKPPVAAVATVPAAPKKKTSLIQFFREVRIEARKITWTTRKETWITSVMVFIMVVIATLFFWLVDAGLGVGVSQIIKIGG